MKQPFLFNSMLGAWSLAMIILFTLAARHAQSSANKKGRALLVGINQYKNFPNNPTPGSEEDAIETKDFIKRQYGFDEAEIRLLRGSEATAKRIVKEFRDWLIAGATASSFSIPGTARG